MFYFPGNEVINFQTNSKIGKQLTEIFQEIIDYRDKFTPDQFATEEQRHKNVITETTEFFLKNSAPKMAAALREMNINLTNFYVYGGDYGFSGNAGVIVHSKDIEASIELERRSVGLNSSLISIPREKDLIELAKVTEITDLKTGTFSKPTFGNGKRVNAALFFDINTFLLAQEFFPGHEDKQFTASEIASIWLHEIGHIHTISEHLANLYHYREREQNIEITLQKADFKTLKSAAPKMLSEIKKRFKALKTEDSAIDKAVGVCDTLEKFFNDKKLDDELEASEDETAPSGSTITNSFFNFLKILLVFAFNTLLSFLTFIEYTASITFGFGSFNPISIVIKLYRELSIFATNLRPSQGIRKSTDTKLNDNTSTMMNYTYVERWADEYVSRMGYGAELASSLNKLNYWMTVATGSAFPVRSAAVRNNNLAITLAYLSGWMARHCRCALWFLGSYTYENQFNRVARLRQNTLAVFKNENLPGDVVDNYIGSLRKLEDELKEAKSIFDNEFFTALQHFLYSVTTGSGILDLLTDANLERDYYKLQNKLDDLSNNPLFYQAARLQRDKR